MNKKPEERIFYTLKYVTCIITHIKFLPSLLIRVRQRKEKREMSFLFTNLGQRVDV